MRLRPIATLVSALCLAAATADASSIGVFFAPDASDCDRQVAQFEPFNVYVIAILGGDPAAAGITGAVFHVAGFEPSPTWLVTTTPSPPSNIQIGGPTTACGVAMGFPSCQTGTVVPLYEMNVFPTQPVSPRSLKVESYLCNTDANFFCPLVTLCDPPVFTKLCVPGGEAFINRPEPCSVGIETKSWGQVKSLFD